MMWSFMRAAHNINEKKVFVSTEWSSLVDLIGNQFFPPPISVAKFVPFKLNCLNLSA